MKKLNKDLSLELESYLKEDILLKYFNTEYFDPDILEDFKEENNLSEKDMNKLIDNILKRN